jgi:hypothetical protein
MKTVQYTLGLKIRNLEALPCGGGCNYLLCVGGPPSDPEVLIAKSWHRRFPRFPRVKEGDTVVIFKSEPADGVEIDSKDMDNRCEEQNQSPPVSAKPDRRIT